MSEQYWDAESAAKEMDRLTVELAELKNQLAISQALNIRMCEEGAPVDMGGEKIPSPNKRRINDT